MSHHQNLYITSLLKSTVAITALIEFVFSFFRVHLSKYFQINSHYTKCYRRRWVIICAAACRSLSCDTFEKHIICTRGASMCGIIEAINLRTTDATTRPHQCDLSMGAQKSFACLRFGVRARGGWQFLCLVHLWIRKRNVVRQI